MSRDESIFVSSKLSGSPIFSEAGQNSFKVLAIVSELATEGGFVSLDAAYEHNPRIVETYCDTARAALRGLAKLQERERKISGVPLWGAANDLHSMDTSDKGAFIIAFAACAFSGCFVGLLAGIGIGWAIWK